MTETKETKKKSSYPKRLLTAGLVTLALCFTFLFFGPLEMVAFSGGSLVYTYRDVIWLLTGMLLGSFLVAAPLLALLRKTAFRVVMSILCGITAAGYVQALLFNTGLGLLTGDAINWSEHTLSIWLGGALWLLLPAGLIVLALWKSKLWKQTVRALSALLVLMQLVPTVGILSGMYDSAQPDDISGWHLSDRDLAVHGENNIYIFVLDRLDYDYIEKALKADPTFLDGLDGFTSYTNAISGYARTRPALVHMLTGAEENTYRVPAAQYYREAWTDSGLLELMQEQGYTTSLYSGIRNLFSDPAYAGRYVDNLSNGTSGMDLGVTASRLLQLSAFRYAPTALKPLFWADTNHFNTGIYYEDTCSAYQFDDVAYAQRLAAATAGEGNRFKLYHFFGPHAPYTMNADGTAGETETTVTAQTIGSFTNLKKIFGRMKELGVYENATIIITGDHGAAMYDTRPLVKATRIGLFYKPAGAAGTPLQTSAAPVSVGNIPATLVKAAGGDYAPYGTPLDEVAEDAAVTRYYYKTVCDPETFRETQLWIYEVGFDASDFANWVPVETVDIPYSYN